MQYTVARQLRIAGRVQGVGFRPFVQRLAATRGLTGWVRNHAGEVTIFVQGAADAVSLFTDEVISKAPPLARPSLRASEPAGCYGGAAFRILTSSEGDASDAQLPPDSFVCDDCLGEMRAPGARRYRHPFINCTQCGPRYTIIRRLPYDRPNTTMAGFPLCADCAVEYADPDDRRYHAQPLACPSCGPRLTYRADSGRATIEGDEAALAAVIAAVRGGQVVAVKGIGGYHLICDAGSADAVARLRARKQRPHKPLAVMVPLDGVDGLAAAHRLSDLDAATAAILRDPMRPIVLTPLRADAPLAGGIAPGLSEVGLMLPYSPLHVLLTEGIGGPIVATSGNISGEPVLTDATDAEARLGSIADAFLHHDRPIERPADDSVFRVIGGVPRPIRLGRGVAPLSFGLPRPIARPTLAVGGHMKATVALAWRDRVVISPHIGDLGAPRSQDVFEQVIADLQALYGVRAERVVHDAHPGYASTRWARASALPVQPVWHHHAHASALCGEHEMAGPALVFAWDGVGLGPDGTLWGGEALLGQPGAWQRVARLRPFRLPGGERAARQPWRSACAICWETGTAWRPEMAGQAVLREAWVRGVNAPETTAAGRLFDAAAALIGIVEGASFEGHAPMWLESLSDRNAPAISLPIAREREGLRTIDWAPLVVMLQDEQLSAGRRGGMFHATLAAAIVAVARDLRDETAVNRVGLTGGVFQNRLLSERAHDGLVAAGFEVLLPTRLPANDGGISYGQIVEVLASDERTRGRA